MVGQTKAGTLKRWQWIIVMFCAAILLLFASQLIDPGPVIIPQLYISESCPNIKMELVIVYFIYLDNGRYLHWKELLEEQWKDNMNNGLFSSLKPEFHIVLQGNQPKDVEEGTAYLNSLYSEASIPFKIYSGYGNQYEYPGIHLVWKLAQEYEQLTKHSEVLPTNRIFFYFHSKGMVNFQSRGRRKTLRDRVVDRWKVVLDSFCDSTIRKASFAGGWAGWGWYNYWFVRQTYLQGSAEPYLSPDNRYYFEHWLGSRNISKLSEEETLWLKQHPKLPILQKIDKSINKLRPDEIYLPFYKNCADSINLACERGDLNERRCIYSDEAIHSDWCSNSSKLKTRPHHFEELINSSFVL